MGQNAKSNENIISPSHFAAYNACNDFKKIEIRIKVKNNCESRVFYQPAKVGHYIMESERYLGINK